jgi:hypothetical protein
VYLPVLCLSRHIAYVALIALTTFSPFVSSRSSSAFKPLAAATSLRNLHNSISFSIWSIGRHISPG